MHVAHHNTSGVYITETFNTLITSISLFIPRRERADGLESHAGVRFANAAGDDSFLAVRGSEQRAIYQEVEHRCNSLGQVVKPEAVGGGGCFTYLRISFLGGMCYERTPSYGSERADNIQLNPDNCQGVLDKWFKVCQRKQEDVGFIILSKLSLAIASRWQGKGAILPMPLGYNIFQGRLPSCIGPMPVPCYNDELRASWLQCPDGIVAPKHDFSESEKLSAKLLGLSGTNDGITVSGRTKGGISRVPKGLMDDYVRRHSPKLRGEALSSQLSLMDHIGSDPDAVAASETVCQDLNLQDTDPYTYSRRYCMHRRWKGGLIIAAKLREEGADSAPYDVRHGGQMMELITLAPGLKRIYLSFSMVETYVVHLEGFSRSHRYAMCDVNELSPRPMNPPFYGSSSPFMRAAATLLGMGHDMPYPRSNVLDISNEVLTVRDVWSLTHGGSRMSADEVCKIYGISARSPDFYSVSQIARLEQSSESYFMDLCELRSTSNYKQSGVLESINGCYLKEKGFVTCDHVSLGDGICSEDFQDVYLAHLIRYHLSAWSCQYEKLWNEQYVTTGSIAPLSHMEFPFYSLKVKYD
jgi:hypothetical protein